MDRDTRVITRGSDRREAAWESVIGTETARLKVPGGWLYREIHFGYEENSMGTVALAFVPDVPAVVQAKPR